MAFKIELYAPWATSQNKQFHQTTNISTLNKLVDCSFKMSLNGYNSGNNKLIAVIKGLNLKLILQDTVEIFVFCQRISNSTTVTQKMEIHQSLLSKTKKSYHYLGMSWIIYKNWKNIWRMTLYLLQEIYLRSYYFFPTKERGN